MARAGEHEWGRISHFHFFETPLDPQPGCQEGDYYFSAHFSDRKLHFNPRWEDNYEYLWGKNPEGEWVSHGLCGAGFWSEIECTPAAGIRLLDEKHLQPDRGVSLRKVIEQMNWGEIPRNEWPPLLEAMIRSEGWFAPVRKVYVVGADIKARVGDWKLRNIERNFEGYLAEGA
jgi:hypothetical protein